MHLYVTKRLLQTCFIPHRTTTVHLYQLPTLSNLLDILAYQLRPLNVQLIPQHSKRQIRHQQALAKTPHKRNRIEEVCIAAASIDPEMVERRPEEGGIHDGG